MFPDDCHQKVKMMCILIRLEPILESEDQLYIGVEKWSLGGLEGFQFEIKGLRKIRMLQGPL